MDLVRLYGRALGMLAAEKSLAVALALASVAIGVVQLAEPILFGRVVDALSRGEGAFPTIALWAALGLFGILSSVVVAVHADRMAHRRHLAAMADAFERADHLAGRLSRRPRLGRRRALHPAGHGRPVLALARRAARAADRRCRHRTSGSDRHRNGRAHGRHPRPACARLRRHEQPRHEQDERGPGQRRALQLGASTGASATSSATSRWCKASRASKPRARPCAAS